MIRSSASRRTFVAGVGGLLVSAALGACGDGQPTAPVIKNTREQVAADYMAAVQAGDVEKLRSMSSPEFEADEVTAAITRKLDTVGRRPWTDPKVTWVDGVTPEMTNAEITATDQAGEQIKDVAYLVVVEDTWRVALGPDA